MNLSEKLMDIARFYQMPADEFNIMKKAAKIVEKPSCSLDKCPFLEDLDKRLNGEAKE